MTWDELIELCSRTKNQCDKAMEKRSMIPPYLHENFDFIQKSLPLILEASQSFYRYDRIQAEKRAELKAKGQLLEKEVLSILDDLSVMNNEARYIVSRNKDNEASMDKMSAEAVQHYVGLIETRLKKIKDDLALNYEGNV